MSLSQPCLPVANVGPTRILPHLYLGSQKDVLNKVQIVCFIHVTHTSASIHHNGEKLTRSWSPQDLMAQNGITYVLNASNTCPKPDFISEGHFMRIPVNDNYCEKLLPWLDKTNEFIGKMRRRATLFDTTLLCSRAALITIAASIPHPS